MSEISESQAFTEIQQIFADVFMRDDLSLSESTTAKDIPEWDSFKHIEIIMAVEEHFGVKLSTKQIDGLKNVGDLAKAVVAKRV